MSKIAILIDGGHLRYLLGGQLKRQLLASDITNYCKTLSKNPKLASYELFRIYYYDCLPTNATGKHPVTNNPINFGNTPSFVNNKRLIQQLEMEELFAVRKGELDFRGWKLNKKTSKPILSGKKTIAEADIIPDMSQKGVDMRIGLDIAWLAIKRIVDGIVLVTADSDFIPAMKLARKEGLRIFLDTAPQAKRELKVHADIII